MQVLLLDNKKSMSVNIFLKQFKENHAQIVAMIQEGDVSKIGNERLRGLQKIMPDVDDVCVQLYNKLIIYILLNDKAVMECHYQFMMMVPQIRMKKYMFMEEQIQTILSKLKSQKPYHYLCTLIVISLNTKCSFL